MPPSSSSSDESPSPPPQNDALAKYRFPYSNFIVYAILGSVALFFVFVLTVYIMFGQISSKNTFNQQFYDNCLKSNYMGYMFQLRDEICDAKTVLKELKAVEVDKISNTNLVQAIEEEIISKSMMIDRKTSTCEFEENHCKAYFDKKNKNVMKDQIENINLVFYIYVPISSALLIGIFVGFWKAESHDLNDDQKKAFKILAILFACHAFIHILILYSIIYDNNYNFKAKELPSFCTKDVPYLTEECYLNGTDCLEMFDLPHNDYGALTIVNYLFWQFLLFVICMILMEKRSAIRDGYEEV